MSYFRAHVDPDAGEPYDIPITARDVLLWERTTHGKSVSGLMANMNLTDLYKLTYLAAKRLGKFAGTQAEFEASCDIRAGAPDDEGEGEADPTRPAP